jgi:SAM-dependent methyltransferase
VKYHKCICGSDAKLVYSLKNKVYYCSECELFFAPSTQFNLSFKSALNEEKRINALKKLRQSNFVKIINKLKHMVPNNALGLEVGSSYGWFLETAKENGLKCIGVEPEENIWKISVNEGFEVIKGFFPEDIPKEMDSFDFIIFNDVLEHIPNVDLVLKKCRELLKEGGTLIINIPQSTGIFYKIAQIFYFLRIKVFLNRLWQFDFHSPHFYYFNKESLNKTLIRNNLMVFEYHKLDTLRLESIKERIVADETSKSYSNILASLLRIMLPILKRLSEDIGCFYVKKL